MHFQIVVLTYQASFLLINYTHDVYYIVDVRSKATATAHRGHTTVAILPILYRGVTVVIVTVAILPWPYYQYYTVVVTVVIVTVAILPWPYYQYYTVIVTVAILPWRCRSYSQADEPN